MDIANLIIRVTNEGLDRATRELDRLRAASESAARGAEGLSESLSTVSKYAAVGLAGMTAAIGLSINKAQSWETAMAEINKTVNFAADDGLANMRKELQALTTQIPQTFEELAAVTATGGQLGIAEKDLVRFTEVMAKMGVAFDIPAQQAADSMAKIANVFQIPIANINQLGDAINTLSNNTPATAAQLIDSLQRVGGVAKVFGLSADAALGLTGALIAMGKPAEVASTAVNSLLTTFSTLDNATKSQIIGFEKLGLNMEDFSKLVATDGKQAIITYLEAINKLEQSERIGTNALIIGKEFGDDITMLAGSVGVLENNWAMLGETADTTKEYLGSMDEEFSKISATSANKMTLFKNNIDGVVSSVGDAFIPALNDLLLNMTPMVAAIGEWAAANPELIKQIAVIGGTLLGTVVGLKLAVDGFLAVKNTIDGLKAAFTVIAPAIKTAFTFLTSGIGLPLIAIAALIAAGVLLYQNWDVVKEKASELNEWIKSKFGSLPEPLQQAGRDIAQVFMFIWNTGREYLTLMSELYSGTFESFKTIATGVFQVVWSIIKVSFSGIVNTISAALQIIATLFSGGFAIIKNTVTTVLAVVKAIISGDFKAIPGIIGNGLKAAASIVGSMMTNILNIIKNAGLKLFSIGKDFIQGFINGIKSVGSGVASAASTMVGNAIAAVKKRQDSASPSKVTTKLGGDFAKGMENGIKKGKKAVVSEAQKMAADAIKATQDGIAGLQKELALFGSSGKVAEIEYDIKTGKLGGNTGQLLELAKQLELRKTESSVISDIVSMQREIHNLTTPYTNELSKVKYELESIEGKYRNVSELQKELLLEAANELDAYRLANTARSAMLDITRQMALLDDNSMFATLSYDLNDVKNQISELSDTIKGEWLEAVANLERAKESKAINDSIATSIAAINKEIALFSTDGFADELLYDLENTKKYAGAAEESINSLYDSMFKLEALKADKNLSDALIALESESPLGKIEADYAKRNALIEAYERTHTDMVEAANMARLASDKAYMDAKTDLMLNQGEALFSGLSGLAKSFAGEQSGIYRALFAVEKGFAVAQAAIAIQQSIAKAMAVGFPANIPLIGAAISQGAGIIRTIKGVNPQGFKQGGYTGTMGVNDVAGVVHGQEYVFDAQATKRIGVDNLNAMRRGDAPKGGGDVQVNIINNSSARVQASDDGRTITISDVRNEARNEAKRAFSNLQNPNSHESKMVNRNVQAPRRR